MLTATRAVDHRLLPTSSVRSPETVLCCCEVDFRRHPAAWGYAWLLNAGSANSATNLCRGIPPCNAGSIEVAGRKSTCGSCKPGSVRCRYVVARGAENYCQKIRVSNAGTTRAALNRRSCCGCSSLFSKSSQPRTADFFETLSLEISGERAFCFCSGISVDSRRNSSSVRFAEWGTPRSVAGAAAVCFSAEFGSSVESCRACGEFLDQRARQSMRNKNPLGNPRKSPLETQALKFSRVRCESVRFASARAEGGAAEIRMPSAVPFHANTETA